MENKKEKTAAELLKEKLSYKPENGAKKLSVEEELENLKEKFVVKIIPVFPALGLGLFKEYFQSPNT